MGTPAQVGGKYKARNPGELLKIALFLILKLLNLVWKLKANELRI
jgi:hypothetical protein